MLLVHASYSDLNIISRSHTVSSKMSEGCKGNNYCPLLLGPQLPPLIIPFVFKDILVLTTQLYCKY